MYPPQVAESLLPLTPRTPLASPAHSAGGSVHSTPRSRLDVAPSQRKRSHTDTGMEEELQQQAHAMLADLEGRDEEDLRYALLSILEAPRSAAPPLALTAARPQAVPSLLPVADSLLSTVVPARSADEIEASAPQPRHS